MRTSLTPPFSADTAFQPKTAMARGVLIVDENLLALIPMLEKKGFKAYSATTGMEDDQIAPMLAHRVFVTNNLEDFREAAAIHEFSIIDTANADQDPESIAKEISQCWMQHRLMGKRPFVLKLMREGGPILEEVE